MTLERISRTNSRKASEVAICSQKLAYSVLENQRCDVRVVGQVARGPAVASCLQEVGTVAGALA